MSFVHKEIRRLMGRAIHQYSMIGDGDHLMVAVSGGKDSLALLWLIRERIRRIPISYRITAVHIDPGFSPSSASQVARFLEDNDFEYRIVHSDIGIQAHGKENRENPCFLCSRLRRKILFEMAEDLGCNTIAFGHHKDDVIETFLLNMFFGASLSTMLPVQYFFNGKLKVIRPFYMVDEDLIRRYVKKMGWQEIDMGCPSAGMSKRKEIKDMLEKLYRTNRKIKGNIFHAIHNVVPEYLP